MSQNPFKRLLSVLTFFTLFVAVCIVFQATPLHAKVSEEEARALENELTPMGAIRAGNSDGSIPAWTGGITQAPASVATYDPASAAEGNFYPDPFANEKPLYIVTSKNMAEHEDKLTPGIQAMLKKYPETFALHVYPTHRTAAAPQWVYDNTKKNAVRAVMAEGDDGIINAYGGIPFPIPKTGAEAISNHKARWNGGDISQKVVSKVVHQSGQITVGGLIDMKFSRPYYHQNAEKDFSGNLWSVLMDYIGPARRKGELILALEPINYSETGRSAWQYMPGQRRIRRAPSIDFDNPNPTFGGLQTYDDAYGFTGSLERFDWKLVGKKEVLIPYNNNRFDLAPADDLFTPNHHNPKYLRWELHRIWTVEATLKEGSRHCYGKRVMYLDEDTWHLLLQDKYDTRGDLWRVDLNTQTLMWDIPCLDYRTTINYDLQVNYYALASTINGIGSYKRGRISRKMYTPQYLRKIGKR